MSVMKICAALCGQKSHNLHAVVDYNQVLFVFQRGWATWTTAAVDKRVVAFVPVVMDLLNLVKVNRGIYFIPYPQDIDVFKNVYKQ